MKPSIFLAFIFFFFLTSVHILHASLHFEVFTPKDIKDVFLILARDQFRYPYDLSRLHTRIVLKPGEYFLDAQDLFFRQLEAWMDQRQKSREYQGRVQFLIQWKRNKEVLFESTFLDAMKWIEGKMKENLKLSEEIRYDIRNPRKLAVAIQKSLENHQDTVIYLHFCKNLPCIADPAILTALIGVEPREPDGMRLRLSSHHYSQEKDKLKWLEEGFAPFTPVR